MYFSSPKLNSIPFGIWLSIRRSCQIMLSFSSQFFGKLRRSEKNKVTLNRESILFHASYPDCFYSGFFLRLPFSIQSHFLGSFFLTQYFLIPRYLTQTSRAIERLRRVSQEYKYSRFVQTLGKRLWRKPNRWRFTSSNYSRNAALFILYRDSWYRNHLSHGP